MPGDITLSHIPILFTIGHSTHTLDAFIKLLALEKIAVLVDVRTIPRSRHNPQFNFATLPDELLRSGIAYMHMKELGGLRRARADSANNGWENASFQGYADYMQSAVFEEALQKLIGAAQIERTAIMCAEAVPWRCHRLLIADALTVRGIQVRHILSACRIKTHVVTKMAQVDGIRITYPRQRSLL
jgi:uncharacterized protein (DUF488 family)